MSFSSDQVNSLSKHDWMLDCFVLLSSNSVKVVSSTNLWTRQPTRLCSETANLCQGVSPQANVIQDSNPDFRINSDSDSDDFWIAPKLLRIHYLVGVSYFTECHKNRPVIVREILINLLKSSIQQWWGKLRSDLESVSGTNHHQKSISFSNC